MRKPTARELRNSPFLRDQAIKDKIRRIVIDALWKDPKYLRLNAARDKLAKLWNRADAYGEPTAPKLDAALHRAQKRIYAYEAASFAKAGVTW